MSRGQVSALQALAGNAAVAQRLAPAPPVVQCATATPSEAAASNDPDKVSDVPKEAWAGASAVDRRSALRVLLRKKIMFSWNDDTAVAIINSYPSRESMTAEDVDAVRLVADRGSFKGGELAGYRKVADEFDVTVLERARQNVATNLGELEKMAKQFGIGRAAEGGASGVPSAMEELQLAAGRVADARRVQAELRRVQVGWKPLDPNLPVLPSKEPILFDPAPGPARTPPRYAHDGGPPSTGAGSPGVLEWDAVKANYDAVEMQVGRVLAANPALYVLAATPAQDQRLRTDDERLQYGRSALAGFDTTPPDQARKELTVAHDRAHAALVKVQAAIGQPKDEITRSNVDTGSMDELGMRVSQYPRFDTPFARWATQHWLVQQRTKKERIADIIDFATAVVLVGATVGTMGGAVAAAAALSGVAAVGASASAGTRLSNASDLQDKQAAGFTPETKIVSDVKVAGAELEAVVATATALLALAAAAKGGASLFGRLFKASSVDADLARLASLSRGRAAKVIATSVKETGVLATAQKAGFGTDVYRLMGFLESGTPEAAEVLKVADLVQKGLMPGVEGGLREPSLSGARPRATLQQLREWDRGKSGKLYVHRTGNRALAVNGTLEPQTVEQVQRVNPHAPEGVYFVEGLEGRNYGEYCFVVREDEMGLAWHPPGKVDEAVSRSSFPPGVGHWFFIDDLLTARGVK